MTGPNLQLLRSDDAFGLPTLGPSQGSTFGWNDRMFIGLDVKEAIDYNDWEARDLAEMLGRDYRAIQIEKVQALPILSAKRKNEAGKGDSGELEWLEEYLDADPLRGGLKTPFELVIDQMTSAFAYRKAYWELAWIPGVGDYAGKTVLDEIGWRPQTTCRTRRDPKTGALLGFEQEPFYLGPEISRGIYPLKIDRSRSMIYIHGARRDPINGTSDMEVAYWAWRTKQKIMLLWFQFLEGVSLPRVAVISDDEERSKQIAKNLALMKSSGILPIGSPGGTDKVRLDQLDLSGKGADQFMAAIRWLDGCASGSVLAGFLDLTGNATDGSGPVGVHLSRDASDFYLQTLEQKAREMEWVVRHELYAPLIRYNFGPSAAVPYFRMEPLNAEDKSAAVEMLTALMSAAQPGEIPPEFVGQLATMVAAYLGMDSAKVEDQFVQAAKDARARAEKMSSQMASPTGTRVAQVNAVTGRAAKLVAAKAVKASA